MTVNARDPISGPFLTDGVTKDFEFTFKLRDAAHMTIVIQNPDGTEAQLITSGIGIDDQYLDNDSGGWLVYPVNGTPVPMGKVIYAVRAVPYDQPNRIGNQGRYYPMLHERSYDYLEFQIQQLFFQLGRAWKAPYGEEGGLFYKIPAGHFWIADADGNAVDGGVPYNGDDTGNPNAAVYQNVGNFKNIALNGSLAEGGLPAIRTPTREALDIATGENANSLLPRQAATDLAECLLIPPTEEQNNFSYADVPLISMNGSVGRRVIPLDIRTVLHDTPISIPLFVPTRTNGYGFLTWRYIGEEPIHTIIKGSLSMTVLSSRTDDTAYSNLLMRLRSADGTPDFEVGENAGNRNLGSSRGYLTPGRRFSNNKDFNDLGFPLTQSILDARTGPERYTGSLPGFFDVNTPDDQLELVDAQGPVGPEVQSTAWMDISDVDKTANAFAFDCGGTSFRSRARYKDDAGNVHYLTGQSSERNHARRAYAFPSDATQVQIYYTGRGSTAASNPVSFRTITQFMSTEAHPTMGYWTQREISVHREVVFWPGAEYYIDIGVDTSGEAVARSWGFRFTSGGLSFLFDAGSLRKKQSNKLFRQG